MTCLFSSSEPCHKGADRLPTSAHPLLTPRPPPPSFRCESKGSKPPPPLCVCVRARVGERGRARGGLAALAGARGGSEDSGVASLRCLCFSPGPRAGEPTESRQRSVECAARREKRQHVIVHRSGSLSPLPRVRAATRRPPPRTPLPRLPLMSQHLCVGGGVERGKGGRQGNGEVFSQLRVKRVPLCGEKLVAIGGLCCGRSAKGHWAAVRQRLGP